MAFKTEYIRPYPEMLGLFLIPMYFQDYKVNGHEITTPVAFLKYVYGLDKAWYDGDFIRGYLDDSWINVRTYKYAWNKSNGVLLSYYYEGTSGDCDGSSSSHTILRMELIDSFVSVTSDSSTRTNLTWIGSLLSPLEVIVLTLGMVSVFVRERLRGRK